MTPWPRCTPRTQAALGLALCALLAWPALRQALEASMWRHMVLQFPLLMGVGALLAAALPPRAHTVVSRWNAHGIAGLVLVAGVLAVLMVPRVLDLALREPAIEISKCAALLGAGAALRLSWRAAGLVVQGFFLGNVLPMTAVVGQLYIDTPLRLCNAYLLDDQARLGQWLVGLAALLALGWLARVGWWTVRREGDAIAVKNA
ncbi:MULTISPECIES: hypothetical protein [Acidovorax]|uniref:Uncharacterized protein n=1 Tax=Acidovorax soli TaxID=592050 RepID=A0A1H4A5W1_9BURK|nr:MULTISPECIES: hypothetical protein [Acidovorax]SEA31297.1 hypothetical protein SAMN05421875_109104 [Acidovorax soli]